ncbi:MAG: protein-L-isoaspartate(D-aspartate) O-methyltransferase [Candidatus Omnitrophota bacterium]|nr:MAG: protein-L-isoaspartate(D-aspartate) O-methyltransferase [Candidatus Omnitrophota bacterium]
MDFSALREEMVQDQLIRRGISDEKVLKAFREVPRHKFVPEKYLDSAYGDFPLPIGEGQTVSQPYMVALMTECLELSGKETVLEIGTGSGYQAAILAKVAGEVYSIERIAPLARQAQLRLKDLGYRNIHIKTGDGTMGWKEFAPYDGIIVTAAAPSVPEVLFEQMGLQAKLVIPLGTRFSQILTVVSKHRDKIETKEICACVFVPLLGKYGWGQE